VSLRPFKLTHQHREQLRLGSDHMFRNLQLRFIELFFPQLLTALLTEMMLARGKAVPFSAAKVRQSLGGRILLEKSRAIFDSRSLKTSNGCG